MRRRSRASRLFGLQDYPKRNIGPLLEAFPLAVGNPSFGQQLGVCCFIFLNLTAQAVKRLANTPALIHVLPLFPAWNGLTARLAVLSIRVATIQFETEFLLFAGILHRAHVAMLNG